MKNISVYKNKERWLCGWSPGCSCRPSSYTLLIHNVTLISWRLRGRWVWAWNVWFCHSLWGKPGLLWGGESMSKAILHQQRGIKTIGTIIKRELILLRSHVQNIATMNWAWTTGPCQAPSGTYIGGSPSNPYGDWAQWGRLCKHYQTTPSAPSLISTTFITKMPGLTVNLFCRTGRPLTCNPLLQPP